LNERLKDHVFRETLQSDCSYELLVNFDMC
jgi:hypothetical protein